MGTPTPIPISHLNRDVDAIRTFGRITGAQSLNESDYGSLDFEAKDNGNTHRCHRKQADATPITAPKAREGFVSDSTLGITGGLFAWSFKVAVAAGLRWGDLLCTAPATLVLMKECLIGFAAKTETRGMSEWGTLGGGP